MDEMYRLREKEYQMKVATARSNTQSGFCFDYPLKTPFQEHMEAKEMIKQIGEREKYEQHIKRNGEKHVVKITIEKE